jgi:hypothetical protein
VGSSGNKLVDLLPRRDSALCGFATFLFPPRIRIETEIGTAKMKRLIIVS